MRQTRQRFRRYLHKQIARKVERLQRSRDWCQTARMQLGQPVLCQAQVPQEAPFRRRQDTHGQQVGGAVSRRHLMLART